jgi:hypothetical protein
MGHPLLCELIVLRSQGESAAELEEVPLGAGVQRVQNAFDFFRRQLEKGGRR